MSYTINNIFILDEEHLPKYPKNTKTWNFSIVPIIREKIIYEPKYGQMVSYRSPFDSEVNKVTEKILKYYRAVYPFVMIKSNNPYIVCFCDFFRNELRNKNLSPDRYSIVDYIPDSEYESIKLYTTEYETDKLFTN